MSLVLLFNIYVAGTVLPVDSANTYFVVTTTQPDVLDLYIDGTATTKTTAGHFFIDKRDVMRYIYMMNN